MAKIYKRRYSMLIAPNRRIVSKESGIIMCRGAVFSSVVCVKREIIVEEQSSQDIVCKSSEKKVISSKYLTKI